MDSAMAQRNIREQLSSRRSSLVESCASPSTDNINMSFSEQEQRQEEVRDEDSLPANSASQLGIGLLEADSGKKPVKRQTVTDYCIGDYCEAATVQIDQDVQLKDMQKHLALKQQEVELLQAQVQRLCNFVDATVGSATQQAEADSSKTQHLAFSSLHMQLEATAQDLLQTREQLASALEAAQKAQSLLAATSAAKATLEKRNSSLRLLLAEHVRDNVLLIQGLEVCQEGLQAADAQLQEAQRSKAAAETEVASQVQQCQALQDALDAANTHITQLVEQHEYHQQMQQPLPQVQLSRKASCCCCQSNPAASAESTELKQQVCRQQQELDSQRRELEKQHQELEAAADQLQALTRLLAIKEDSLAYAERHSSSLEKQLEAANQQLLESHNYQQAPGTDQAVCQAHCILAGAASILDYPHIQQQLEPQQQSCEPGFGTSINIARTSSAGFLDGLAAAISKKFSSDMKDSNGSTSAGAGVEPVGGPVTVGSVTKVCDQPSPLGPFAKARSLIAEREENVTSQLKEELKDKDKQIKELTAAASRIEGQLHGLQTVLAAKTCTCNRLETEMSKVDRQLKQMQAAAAADAEGYKQQLGVSSERVLQLEEQLSVSEHKEQQLMVEASALRAKLSQVLAALVQESDCLMKHKPQHVAQLRDDMTAALADVDPGSCASAAAVQATLASSSAAALAILGGSVGAAAAGVAAGSKETLGNKLMGVLLGRKSSTSIGDMMMPSSTDKTFGDSHAVDFSSRTLSRSSFDGPAGILTPRVQTVCSGSVTPTLRHASSTNERRVLSTSMSRRPSDTATCSAALLTATCGASCWQVAHQSSHTNSDVCSTVAPSSKPAYPVVKDDGAGLGKHSSSSSSTKLEPSVLQEKLVAANELVRQLGSLAAETMVCATCDALQDPSGCVTGEDTRA